MDSSGWLEYFADTDRAPLFAPAIEDAERLLAPVISIYGVFKKALRARREDDALQIASMMHCGKFIDLDCALALEAARHPLPLVDNIIHATAMRHKATLWTQDEHFKDLPGVRYFAKQPANSLRARLFLPPALAAHERHPFSVLAEHG